MSSVPKGKRNESKEEFDNIFYKVYQDTVSMTEIKFGASDKLKEEKKNFIEIKSRFLLKCADELLYHIRLANSLFPTTQLEKEQRRVEQDNAIGVCYTMVTQYELICKTLHISEQKYVDIYRHLSHEINSIKNWRTGDNKRFKNLG